MSLLTTVLTRDLLQVGKFSGNSYIRYPPLGDSALLWLSLKVSFKPESEEGLLLYGDDVEGEGGDFLSLRLSEGYVEVVVEDGSGEVVVRGEERLEVGVWHSVEILRESGELSLTVNSEAPVRVVQAAPQTLSLGQSLWLGGGQTSPGFKGCVKDLVINSLPVELLASAVVTVNLESCHKTATDNTRTLSSLLLSSHHPVPAFSGQTYLAFNSSEIYTK